jgi:hypothetical protein
LLPGSVTLSIVGWSMAKWAGRLGSCERNRHERHKWHDVRLGLGRREYIFSSSSAVSSSPSCIWQDVGNAGCLPNYILKRFTRVYPTYWVVFAAALTGIAVRHYEDVPKNASAILAALALVPQDPAIVGGTGAPVVIVAWSLQYEVLFYTFFALLITSRTAGCLAAGGGDLLAPAGWSRCRHSVGLPQLCPAGAV